MMVVEYKEHGTKEHGTKEHGTHPKSLPSPNSYRQPSTCCALDGHVQWMPPVIVQVLDIGSNLPNDVEDLWIWNREVRNALTNYMADSPNQPHRSDKGNIFLMMSVISGEWADR